jgi:hypothetical protein
MAATATTIYNNTSYCGISVSGSSGEAPGGVNIVAVVVQGGNDLGEPLPFFYYINK